MVEDENTRKVTAQELLSKIAGGKKLSGADILSSMADNKHQKSNIPSPLAYTVMHSVAQWEETVHEQRISKMDWSDVATLDKSMAEFGEDFSVARKGDRANAIIKAVESVLTQEFEIDKSRARRLTQ